MTVAKSMVPLVVFGSKCHDSLPEIKRCVRRIDLGALGVGSFVFGG
jgi:hypothetical protein